MGLQSSARFGAFEGLKGLRKKKAIWPGIIQQPINALAG